MSNQSKVIDAAAQEIVRYIEETGFKFERGNALKYFTHISRVNAGLTLSIVPEEMFGTVLTLKNYYALWNFTVDDEIDREGTCVHLDASLQVLMHRTGRQPGMPQVQGSSATRALIHGLLTKLDALPLDRDSYKGRLREMFYFDLLGLMCGFKYEYTIGQISQAAPSNEYFKYATMVGSIGSYLDLDCLFSNRELQPASYRNLRKAYEHFAHAFRYASDVGSLGRELMEANSANLIRLLALESGVEKVAHKVTQEQFKDVAPSLAPFLQHAHDQATKSLKEGREALSDITDIHNVKVDTESVASTAHDIVHGYFERDLFFWGK